MRAKNHVRPTEPPPMVDDLGMRLLGWDPEAEKPCPRCEGAGEHTTGRIAVRQNGMTVRTFEADAADEARAFAAGLRRRAARSYTTEGALVSTGAEVDLCRYCGGLGMV